MTVLDTEVLVIGSGAGGATTAAMLAEAGRTVTVVEEGPAVDPDEVEPFSLQEMVRKYRHYGSAAALGSPPIAYAEGRCVGGSTEINSGLWHRLPGYLAEEWRAGGAIDGFDDMIRVLDGSRIGDVEDGGVRGKAAMPQLVRRRLDPRCRAAVQHHPGAMLGEPGGERQPDALAGARHQGDPPGNVEQGTGHPVVPVSRRGRAGASRSGGSCGPARTAPRR